MSKQDTKRGKKRVKSKKARAAHVRSSNRLIHEMEHKQARLQKLGYYNRPYDDILTDVIKKHHENKHISRLMKNERKTSFFTSPLRYMVIILAGLFAGGAFYLFLNDPQVTGHAVSSVKYMAANRMASTTIGMTITIIIAGLVFHGVEHKHRHRYDKYKPPLPPEE
ncbi:hypothetical protein ACFL3V_02695 [Nanoarchaeota archaeon]